MRGYDPLSPRYNRVNEIDEQLDRLQHEREELLARGMDQPLEPQVQSIATLAHEAGEMKALYRSEKKRADKQAETISELREKVDDLEGIQQTADEWRARATKAEETLKRSRAARKKKY